MALQGALKERVGSVPAWQRHPSIWHIQISSICTLVIFSLAPPNPFSWLFQMPSLWVPTSHAFCTNRSPLIGNPILISLGPQSLVFHFPSFSVPLCLAPLFPSCGPPKALPCPYAQPQPWAPAHGQRCKDLGNHEVGGSLGTNQAAWMGSPCDPPDSQFPHCCLMALLPQAPPPVAVALPGLVSWVTLGQGWGWDVLLFSVPLRLGDTPAAPKPLLGSLQMWEGNGQGEEAMGGSWG